MSEKSIDYTVSLTYPALSVLADMLIEIAEDRKDPDLYGIGHMLDCPSLNLKNVLEAGEVTA